MLMASHLAGLGQASGTGVGLVHALGHAIGTRGRLAHGTALAVVLPEVLTFYAEEPDLRDRELKLIGVALGAASPTETDATGAVAAIGALRTFLAELGQRPRLRCARVRRRESRRHRPRRDGRRGDQQFTAPADGGAGPAILGSVLD